MKNHMIIVNPISGRGTGELSIPYITKTLEQNKIPYTLVKTEKPMHAVALAREAAEKDVEVVVSVGGDGTANEVLNGLMEARQKGHTRTTMGIIGVGRGNDLAYGMGIPHGVEEGCRILIEGYSHPMDVGLVTGGFFPQGRYFGNGVGIGFDAVVGFVALKMKHLKGFLSYIVAAIKTIFLYFKAPLLKITYDGNTITQSCLMVSIMNGRRMGGGFMMAPDSIPDDGKLDLCIAKQVSRAGIFLLIPRFLKGTQSSHKAILTGRTDAIVVEALEGSLPAHADGETLCTEGQSLSIRILPGQIPMVCPKPETAG
jgi:diacylglycerol kinase (ATP)